jgi:hypothetical protein
MVTLLIDMGTEERVDEGASVVEASRPDPFRPDMVDVRVRRAARTNPAGDGICFNICKEIPGLLSGVVTT